MISDWIKTVTHDDPFLAFQFFALLAIVGLLLWIAVRIENRL